jgi:O-antigen ligase
VSMKTKSPTQSKNSNSVWWMICGISFVTLYFNLKAKDPFNTPKLIVLMVTATWLIGHLLSELKRNPVRLRSNEFLVFLFCLLFIIGMLVSIVFADNKMVAVIGDTQRRNGFLAYFSLIIIFLYSFRVINFANILRIFKAGAIVGSIFSGYGVLQHFDKDFVSWNNPYNPIISTAGNPNFASALMAVFVMISVTILFISKIPVGYKLLSAATIGMSLFAIVSSNSRQGIVALLFGLLIFMSLFFYLRNRNFGFFVIIVSTILSVLALLGMLQKGPLAQFLYKTSVTIRGYYWDAGVSMFLSNPFTGIGMDSYGLYFKEFRNPEYPLLYGFEITSSNAHNTIIQLFATGGIILGVSYLGLLAIILIRGIRLVKNTESSQRMISLGLLSSWVVFQAQSQISIDNVVLSVWGWLLGGSILGLDHYVHLLNSAEPKVPLSIKRSETTELFRVIVSIIFLIPTLIISFALHRSETQSLLSSAYGSNINSQGTMLVEKYSSEVIRNPLADASYKSEAAAFLLDAGYIKEGMQALDELYLNNPRNETVILTLITVATIQKNYDRELEIRTALEQIDPWNAKNFLELLRLYKNRGEIELASEYREKIQKFAPLSEQAKEADNELSQ